VNRSIALKLGLSFLVLAALFVGLAALAAYFIDRALSTGESVEVESDFPESGNPEEGESQRGREIPSPAPWTQPAPPPPPGVGEWIEQLGSTDWKKRVEAEERLVALGRAAVVPLELALNHEDPEVRWRAQEALRRIEEKR
jgi:hypothetical protein